jgi:alpha-L-fucosidase 2
MADSCLRVPGAEVNVSTDEAGGWFSCLQRFPATAPTDAVPNPPASDNDRNFALLARLEGIWAPLPSGSGASGPVEPSATLVPKKEQPMRLDLLVTTPRDHPDNVAFGRAEVKRLQALASARLQRESEKHWREFWSRSAVEFEDQELERIWYHNQYFLACCLRQGKAAPGLFGNWTSGKIGTSWHGDYHMNYNTQQVFWGVFSSNHVDQHVPYVELVENLLPMSERYARENFGLPGAYFPHSAYPVPSRVVAYPAPPWGYEVCETPWVVQSLWWQYVYTHDQDYLRRVYPMLRAATQFLAAT